MLFGVACVCVLASWLLYLVWMMLGVAFWSQTNAVGSSSECVFVFVCLCVMYVWTCMMRWTNNETGIEQARRDVVLNLLFISTCSQNPVGAVQSACPARVVSLTTVGGKLSLSKTKHEI